jgi:2-dehydropantoate 2-reductase
MTDGINPKITIVGPGAMGCLLSAMLWRSGAAVSLLDYRTDRAHRLQEGGIRVVGSEGTWTGRPRVTEDPSTLEIQDVLVFMVKANRTASAISGLGPVMGPETIAVSLQNGIGHEDVISTAIPLERVALGVTSQGATLMAEGVVRHAGRGPTVAGMARPEHPTPGTLDWFCNLLNQSGWPARTVQDVLPHIWRKLLVNVGINALTALTGLTNGALLEHPDTKTLLGRAVEEAWHVALASGIRTELTLDEAIDSVRQVCRATSANRSSMLQDRIQKRKTEIDYINGAVTRIGGRLGISTPVNETLAGLVRVNSGLGWAEPVLFPS